MEIMGLIPARGGSKGIKGKNIKPLGGRPLIEYTFDAAKASRRLSRLVLSTDSPDIADVGKRCGVAAPFLRPPDISTDESPATAYVHHCLNFLDETEHYRPDVVVILQPTTPFRRATDIDACIDLLLSGATDSVVSVSAVPGKYHPAWQLVVNAEGLLSPYVQHSWDQIAPRRQDLAQTYTRNGAIYAFRTETFLAGGSIYGANVTPYIMPTAASINIDDMDDWEKAEAIVRSGLHGEHNV
jgi:CMP-N,N'-diacetyllegionaminic acid synthase